MKNIFYLLIFLFASFHATAQQETNYTFFMYNQQAYNPAYVGSKGYGSFMALYRHQWMGFGGAPKSQLLSYQSPFINENQAIGATVMHFEMGITRSWMANLAYSYKLKLSDDWGIRIGLQGVFRYQGINFQDEKVVVSVLDDPSFNTTAKPNKYFGNVGGGIYLTHKESFYFGASVPHLLDNETTLNRNVSNSDFAKYKPHFYFNTGVRLSVTEKMLLNPNLLVKYVGNAPTNIDLNLNCVFSNGLTVGVSGRHGSSGTFDSVDFLASYQFDTGLGIGFAYDYTLSEIKGYSNGSIEGILLYNLGGEENDLENPRYF